MKNSLHILGLMSGSSCDGIDAALVRITGDWPKPAIEVLFTGYQPYSVELRERLLAQHPTLQEVAALDMELGHAFGQFARRVMTMAEQRGHPLPDRIASHGHTLAHVPPRADAPEAGSGTLQIACPAAIAAATDTEVVADFRRADMAQGGQGAPLVPFADWLLFHRGRGAIACLNIGGIANVTVVTPDPEKVIAFDTGPGNMPIDGAVRRVTDGKLGYDVDGEIAARGRVHQGMLKRLLAHPYFKRPLPKSTGREEFDASVYLADAFAKGIPDDNLVATVTAAVADSIVQAVQREVIPAYNPVQLIVSGGGALNPVIMERLTEGLAPLPVEPDTQYPPDMREAIAFALLGWAHAKGVPSNLPGVTGASRAIVLGSLTRP